MAPTIADPYLPAHKNLTTHTTIEEFARNNDVTAATVKKHYKQIPGIKKIGLDEYMVTPGTRYPLNRRGYTLKTNSDRINVLMTAICLERYISHNELGTNEYEFMNMLHGLEEDGYIEKNEYAINFSSYAYANAYKCTERGEKFYNDLKKLKREERNAMISQALVWLDQVAEIVRKFIPCTNGNGNDNDK